MTNSTRSLDGSCLFLTTKRMRDTIQTYERAFTTCVGGKEHGLSQDRKSKEKIKSTSS